MLIILIGLGGYNASAQLLPNKIDFETTMFSYKLHQGKLRIGRDQMKAILRKHPTQLQNFNSGNTSLAVSTLFQLVGLVAIGGYASDRLFNNNIRNEFLIGGGVLLAISIPINVTSKRKIGTAVASYNIAKSKEQ